MFVGGGCVLTHSTPLGLEWVCGVAGAGRGRKRGRGGGGGLEWGMEGGGMCISKSACHQHIDRSH